MVAWGFFESFEDWTMIERMSLVRLPYSVPRNAASLRLRDLRLREEARLAGACKRLPITKQIPRWRSE